MAMMVSRVPFCVSLVRIAVPTVRGHQLAVVHPQLHAFDVWWRGEDVTSIAGRLALGLEGVFGEWIPTGRRWSAGAAPQSGYASARTDRRSRRRMFDHAASMPLISPLSEAAVAT